MNTPGTPSAGFGKGETVGSSASGAAGGAGPGGALFTNQPIVIDNGTGVIKAGFAGGEAPSCVFSSVVGRTRHPRVMLNTSSELEGDVFLGSTVDSHRGVMRLSWPMEHGIVTEWADMERVWEHVYSKHQLGVSKEEHPVLLTEAPLNPRRNRDRMGECFFEQFGVPALYVSPQATLALYASGRTTGVVLDSGDGVTHCVPVYEGFTLPHAITRIDVAGRDVTDSLMLHLRRAGHVFHTSAEREVVRTIKEKACYVAFDLAKEESAPQRLGLSTGGGEGGEAGGADSGVPGASHAYKLPDGRIIHLGAELFRAPEVLFDPSLVGLEYRGVHECLADAIWKSDLDLRRTLFSQIVLAGGSTMFPGFGDRLLNEVRKIAQSRNAAGVKIRIAAPPNRDRLTWVGGSILASLATFKSMWVRREEWEEYGSSVLHRRSL